MGREPPEPVEIGERQGVEEEPFQPEDEHVEIEQAIKDELIKQYSYLIDYKMVYTVDPNHRLLILRFPNRRRDEDYFGDNNQPMELRIKPKCGQVELDVPLNFKLPETDHQRMMKLQQAVHKSLILQKGESYGLAGGFGVNEEPKPSKKNNGKSKEKETTESPEPNDDEPGPPKKKKGKAKEKETSKSPEPDDEDEGVPHWPLKKITLGGMIQRYDDTKPRLMVGTFKGSEYIFKLPLELVALSEACEIWCAD